MPHAKIDSFTYVMHLMLYALGSTGAVLFALIAYLESRV